jgi:hypothetical protein
MAANEAPRKAGNGQTKLAAAAAAAAACSSKVPYYGICRRDRVRAAQSIPRS